METEKIQPLSATLFMKKKEVWSFGLSGLGQNMIYGMMSFYLMIFYTDSMGINPGVVGIMLTLARVWDALNDPFMGTLVDRFNFKRGKFKPFLMATPVPIALLTILIFVNPGFNMTGKIIYMYITYFLWGMVYTISDVPFWGLAAATTPNEKERSNFIGYARIFCAVGAMLPMILMIFFESLIDNITMRYTTAAIVIAVVGAALFYLAPLNVKERVVTPYSTTKFSENFTMLKNNKPLLLVLIAGIIGGLRMLAQSAAIYVARYNFMDGVNILGMVIDKENTVVMILGAGFGIGMMLGTVFAPFIQRKINFKQLYIYSTLLAFVVQLIFFFTGYSNIYLVMCFLAIAGFTLGIYNMLTYTMIADSVDYLEWKTGKRAEGLCFSFQTFMTKLAAGLAAGVTSIVLVVVKFQKPLELPGGDILPIVQDGTVLTGLFALISLVPAIACLVSIIPILFYDFVGEKQQKILAELRDNRAKRDNKEISKSEETIDDLWFDKK